MGGVVDGMRPDRRRAAGVDRVPRERPWPAAVVKAKERPLPTRRPKPRKWKLRPDNSNAQDCPLKVVTLVTRNCLPPVWTVWRGTTYGEGVCCRCSGLLNLFLPASSALPRKTTSWAHGTRGRQGRPRPRVDLSCMRGSSSHTLGGPRRSRRRRIRICTSGVRRPPPCRTAGARTARRAPRSCAASTHTHARAVQRAPLISVRWSSGWPRVRRCAVTRSMKSARDPLPEMAETKAKHLLRELRHLLAAYHAGSSQKAPFSSLTVP